MTTTRGEVKAHRKEGQRQENNREDTQCLHVAVGRVGEVVESESDEIFGSVKEVSFSDCYEKLRGKRQTGRRRGRGWIVPSRRDRSRHRDICSNLLSVLARWTPTCTTHTLASCETKPNRFPLTSGEGLAAAAAFASSCVRRA